jgi:filamentous hemagglutinin family protein
MVFDRRQLWRGLPGSSLLAGCSLACLAIGSAHAQNVLPTQGMVKSGAATIGQSGANMNINQTTPRAIVNWNSFSVGAQNSVTFTQPSANAAILNRVTGATNSTIAGQISANGQVFLVNPNGIAITPTGNVKVGGGFVASTLGISNNDFNNGNLNFTGDGASASISNAGVITTLPGGFVGLVGGRVATSGVINAPLGKIGLGSGEQATLDLNGDNFLQVAIPTNATTADGKALVDQSGKVRAAGGSVQLKAATAAAALRDAVNVSGVTSARSARASGGGIILDGGAGGNVTVTGRLDASGTKNGGAVSVTGRNVALSGAKVAATAAQGQGGTVKINSTRAVSLAASNVDVSAASGGGTIEIGGGPKGARGLVQALSVSLDAATTLKADATATGTGGSVILWSTASTEFAGSISASGGPGGGDGGFVETSSAGTLTIDSGATVTASATNGNNGTWLLDPSDLTIDLTAANTISATLAGGTDVTESTSASGTSGFGNVTSGTGDINVGAPISWSTSATLTMSAYNNINVNSTITVSGGGAVSLTTNNAGANSGASLNFAMGQGSIQYTAPAGAGASLSIQGQPYTLLYDMGATATGIQSMNGTTGHFALALPIDATLSPTFDAAPVATFGGTFNGLGNTISNLTINSGGLDAAATGLIALLSPGGTVQNIGLVGGSITRTTTSAAIAYSIGELVGDNFGTITNAYATGTVTDTSDEHAVAGGLVGSNEGAGTVSNSYATGAVAGKGFATGIAGGLVGSNVGQIANSFALGSVVATGTAANGADAGGLVGSNSGTITNAYATGTVTATIISSSSNTSSLSLGGLVGNNAGAITNGIWDSTTTGVSRGVGTGTDATTNETTAGLTSAAVLTTLNGAGVVWGNVRNQTTPYIISNPGPVYLSTDANPIPTPYTLVFNFAQLQAIGGNLTGNFALATSIDATGYAGFTPIGATTEYDGNFNGLGNTIDNLTIDTTSANAGLFGQLGAYGTIKKVGLVGGSVTDATDSANVGGLVGLNFGAITEAYASATVTGGTSANVGGLVGENEATIAEAFAAGAVTGGGDAIVGGLVGYNAASGTFTDVYAIGTVNGGSGGSTGGLVGSNDGVIVDAYATGAVSGGTTTGGLVAVQGAGTASDAYWDLETTGQPMSAGGAPMMTAALQAALPTFTTPGNWGIVAGKSYPYLCVEFAGCTVTPQVVAGKFYTDQGFTAAGSGINIQAAVGGVNANSAQTGGAVATGANGYYYDLLAPGAIPANGAVLTYSGSAPKGAVLVDQIASGYVSNADIFENTLHVVTPAALYSTVSTDLSTAIGSNAAASTLVASLPNLAVDASNAFTIDQAISGYSGNVIVSTPGNLTIGAGGSVTGGSIMLETLGAFVNQAGARALTATAAGGRWLVYSVNPNNDTIGGLTPNFYEYGATYTIGQDSGSTPLGAGNGFLYSLSPTITITGVTRTYNATTGLPTDGTDYTTTQNAGDTVTLNASGVAGAFASANFGTGIDVTITTPPTFTATRGGVGIFGYVLGRVISDPIGTITPAPLTYAVANANSTYGTTATPGAATLSGVFAGDTVNSTVGVFQGATPITLAAKTNAATYSELVTAITNSNYTLAATGNTPGTLTISPLALTYSVANASSTYGTTATLGAVTLNGVLAGDTVTPTAGAFSGATPIALGPKTNVGQYSELVTAITNPNYVLATSGNAPGTLTISPLTLTYSVADANSIFGATPILGEATLHGILAGDSVDPTVQAFAGASAIALNPGTPAGQYPEKVTLLSNPNYAIALTGNVNGLLTVFKAPVPETPLPGMSPSQFIQSSISGGGGGVVELWPEASNACNTGPNLPEPNSFSDPLKAVEAISNSMSRFLQQCQYLDQRSTADALDKYAAELEELAPRLPPALRNLPALVSQAARRVRAAPSKAAAAAVLRQTVAIIHKELALVRSDDPVMQAEEITAGNSVAGALSVAGVELVNSGGL